MTQRTRSRFAQVSRIIAQAMLLGLCMEASAECVEHGVIDYVCGTPGAEDIVAIPKTQWIIASGLSLGNASGRLTLIDRANKTATGLFPTADSSNKLDARAYRDCPGPVDTRAFSAHGLSVRPGHDRVHTLYVVNHGQREAVEVFDLDVSKSRPTLSWKGCVVLPQGSLGNGVTPLEHGGIAVTLTSAPQYFSEPGEATRTDAWAAKFKSAQPTGHVVEWLPGHAWKVVPKTAASGPNGIEVSADGRWLWVANWASQEVVRVPRRAGDQQSVLKLNFMPDNVRWGDDGLLWVAGAAGTPTAYFECWAQPGCKNDFAIAKIDPSALTITSVSHPRTLPEFGEVTTALKVADELWLAAFPGDRIGYLRLDD